MRHLTMLAFLFGLGACEVGEDAALFEDVESGTVVLEGEPLVAELANSPIREAPAPFVRLGFLYDADRPEGFEVSTSADGDEWSAWVTPVVHHTEVEQTAGFVGQIEIGARAQFYRLRGITGATVSFVRMEMLAFTLSESIESGEPDTTTSIARSIGGIEVSTRAQWGARAANCSSSLGTVTRMAIHHTETPTNDTMSAEARLRQIQSYHMDVKGWCDIGYHYLVSRDGRLWDGRPDSKLGAHAGGANTGNIGISVMGTHDSEPITQSQLDSIASLVRALADAHSLPITRAKIKGHREYTSTSCPGDELSSQLDAILAAANTMGGGVTMPGTCSLPTDGPWTCGGLTGSTTNTAGTYATTSFGCWIDEDGDPQGDAGDNCIPACGLSSIGCSGMTGPACERHHNWYTADSDRFGCGARLKVTNIANGKSAILIAIDRGPNCSIENSVDFWVLDMSYPASNYLVGGPTSAGEHADVQVEVVAANTPLGPYSGSATCGGDTGPDTVTVKGVLYSGSTTSTRIAGATITLGSQTTSTDSTGSWQLANVPTGTFTITAGKTGFVTGSITRMTEGPETWASFGLAPVASTGNAGLQGVVYRGSSSTDRIPNASMTVSTGQTAVADGNGYYKILNLPPGAVTITASAPGFTTGSVSRTLTNGVTEWGSVKLAP